MCRDCRPKLGNDVVSPVIAHELAKYPSKASPPSIPFSYTHQSHTFPNLLTDFKPPLRYPISLSTNNHTQHTSATMARGNSPQTQVFYKGSSGDQFCVFVESEELLRKWKADSTIPMTTVVAGWKIMVPEYVVPLISSPPYFGTRLVPSDEDVKNREKS